MNQMFQQLGVSILAFVGLLQIVGYSFQLDSIRGLGFLSVAAPLPIVFTDRGGNYEDFATEYEFHLSFESGIIKSFAFDRKAFAELSGPLDRRGVYSSALMYMPLQSPEAWASVIRAAFCQRGAFTNLFALKEEPSKIQLLIRTKTLGRERELSQETECPK